jgi:hypothetical protein
MFTFTSVWWVCQSEYFRLGGGVLDRHACNLGPECILNNPTPRRNTVFSPKGCRRSEIEAATLSW